MTVATDSPVPTTDLSAELERILEHRVMVMDGSWGVLLQDLKLSEAEFRGERLIKS